MAEEENEQQQEFGAQDYLDNLTALRETMVSREEYQRILDDNRRMANALASGDYSQEEEQGEAVDIDELRKQLFHPENQKKTNLQYFTEVMALRDALIERGERDPFLPYNRDYVPNMQDTADAERIAGNIKECIERADGDPGVFNVELQRRCGLVRKVGNKK